LLVDPTQYTITQKVTQEPYHDTSHPLFYAAYKFTFPFLTGTCTPVTVMDSFAFSEPAIQGSPSIGLELDELLTFDSDAFNEIVPFGDKSLDLYDLHACLATEWRIHSPATSTSSAFSEGYMSPSLTEIPTIVSLSILVLDATLIN
jgi:hypothetical protein